MTTFFVELLCEEIPARFQKQACLDFERLFGDALKAQNVPFENIKAFITPRRMVLKAEGLPLVQQARDVETKGPRADAPQVAIDGFLKSCGVTLAHLTLEETPKGKVYFYRQKVEGRKVDDVLLDILPSILLAFPWPKSMRWGSAAFTWVRPLVQIMAYFNDKPLDGTLHLNGKSYTLSHHTAGHRYLGKGRITPKSFDDYVQKLEEHFVLLESEKRSAAILKQAQKLAKDKGLVLKEDTGLLEEITGLTEWPNAFLGKIEQSFVHLPAEVLTTSMRVHQRYFSLQNQDGSFAPHFIVVANTIPDDDGKAIIKGNERVLRARLSDARFFYDLDLKTKLEDRLPKLAKIVFHAQLGTVLERAERLSKLAGHLAEHMDAGKADVDYAKRAGLLCKADLVTEMVQEFPEIQGVMGGYYARHDKEHESVAEAIALHYNPKGPQDILPKSKVAIAVALAEKIDAIVGFFGLGLKPTGSKDPFALRRAALGIVRILLSNDVTLSLKDPFLFAFDLFENYLGKADKTKVIEDIFAFMNDRLRVFFKDQGLRHDVIEAVLSKDESEPFMVMARKMRVLNQFLNEGRSKALMGLYKRALNISDSSNCEGSLDAVNQNLFQEPAEKELYEAIHKGRPALVGALENSAYEEALHLLLKLESPTSRFFNEVFVNADDASLKANRLNVVASLVENFHHYADFSKIEGI